MEVSPHVSGWSADNWSVTAVTVIRSDMPSFRLVHPTRSRTRVDVAAAGVLAITAVGLWLIVLPVEFLAFLG